jgi:predicted dienelactone hydrolase
MATFVTAKTGDGTVIVSPKNEADQSALVVIAHGLGDTAEGFEDVAQVRLLDLFAVVVQAKRIDSPFQANLT